MSLTMKPFITVITVYIIDFTILWSKTFPIYDVDYGLELDLCK